ncbi:unnamed protein product [Symbiodinium sp. CCMP2592]|nr:unnamed protein product [Symbiodinium sp. CCMP2592]
MAGPIAASTIFVSGALLAICAAAAGAAMKLALHRNAGAVGDEAPTASSGKSTRLLFTISAVAAIAVDSFVEVITLPILAHAAEGEYSVMFFFARPVLGFATTAALFPILRTRSAAAATRLSAAGLAMLSLPWAAVAFKTEPGLWVGICYHVGAVASALVKVPILHSLLLAGPCWAGWRASAAFFGALLGPSLAGPLSSWTDEDSLMALLVIVGGVTCAAQLCAAETLHGPVESEDPGADLSSEESGHLLAGSAVATLLLSVQGALVPLLIRSSSMAAGGLEVVSVILTGAGLFLAAWLARRLAPRGVVLSLFLASAMAALALRGVLRSLGVARSHELTFARLALQTALGGLLGLGVSLPTRLRYAAAPATADALRSCGLAAAAFFGECLGLTLQLLLLPVLGAELTLSAMAMAPLIYSFAMILRLPKAGRSKIGEDDLSDTLDLSERREVTKYVRGANSGRTKAESS